MAPIGRSLSLKGYVVVNEGYPSRRQTIEASAAVIGRDVALCRTKGAAPIDFVTHSQGAIVLRQYFVDHTVAEAGRVVMLAPPNHGSEIADHLRGRWWYDVATGPAGQELGTDGSKPAEPAGGDAAERWRDRRDAQPRAVVRPLFPRPQRRQGERGKRPGWTA